MKKLILLFVATSLCISVFTFSKSPTKIAQAKVRTDVYHLFTHALIAYPTIAFDEKNVMSPHYDRDCLTVKEFKSILLQLYQRDFVLVSPSDLYYYEGKIVHKNNDFGSKKPLILSFDDINYYSKKLNLGMNDKIILDERGNLATFTKNASPQINYDNEVVTVLENFIKAHPDFSYNNAKGTICLTGFDGILGYRTQKKSLVREQEIATVTPIVAKLKELNWQFACHSYGHYHMKNITYETFMQDTDAWIKEVQSLVGKTDIYCYPFGEYEIENNVSITAKQRYLLDCGFGMFWGVGNKPFWLDMPQNNNAARFSFMDRIAMDGYTLRNRDMSTYYNNSEVIDLRRKQL